MSGECLGSCSPGCLDRRGREPPCADHRRVAREMQESPIDGTVLATCAPLGSRKLEPTFRTAPVSTTLSTRSPEEILPCGWLRGGIDALPGRAGTERVDAVPGNEPRGQRTYVRRCPVSRASAHPAAPGLSRQLAFP